MRPETQFATIRSTLRSSPVSSAPEPLAGDELLTVSRVGPEVPHRVIRHGLAHLVQQAQGGGGGGGGAGSGGPRVVIWSSRGGPQYGPLCSVYRAR